MDDQMFFVLGIDPKTLRFEVMNRDREFDCIEDAQEFADELPRSMRPFIVSTILEEA